MGKPLDIGIAGAGIGGLAAAALLAGAGHRVRVFDRFDTPRPVGSGLVIQPVGQEVLAEAGAARAALAGGAPIWRMLGHEAETGARVLDVSYGPGGGARFGLAIHRATLFDALLAAAREAGAVLEPGAEVTGADAGRLAFAGGGTAGPFDLVIDASGAHSRLSPLRSAPLPFAAVWGTVDWPRGTAIPEGLLSQRYRRAASMAGVMPCGTPPGAACPRATIFWSLPAGSQHDWRARGLADWRARVETLWPEAMAFFGQMGDLGQMTYAAYSHGTLRRPAGDRLAFIGDAAHRASPQLGQGANMALLDAWALARALEAAPVDVALTHYVRARRWHVRVYQGMSRVFTPQYQSDSRWLPVLRDRVLAPASRVGPVPAILTRLVCGDLLPPLASLAPPRAPAGAPEP